MNEHTRNQSGQFHLALLDLDGTLYRGHQVIEGAPEFVQRVRNEGMQPVFFTNNATRSPQEVVLHLATLGIGATEEEVCTSAQATAWLIRQSAPAGTSVGYIGTRALADALSEQGLVPVHVTSEVSDLSEVRVLAMGLDSGVSYKDLARFCQRVLELGNFFLTNGDLRLPSGDGLMPGNGALGQFVSAATGILPTVVGKPESVFVDYALRRFHGKPETTVIIGDNLKTDIAAGQKAGIYAIHVKSGVEYKAGEAGRTMDQNVLAADETALSVAELFTK